MITLNNKYLKRKTRQSDTNTKRIVHKFDAYYNPEDEKSKDRAYQYSLGATKKEYRLIKKKAEEVGDAIREVLSENLVGKINTKAVRQNLAEALEKMMNAGTITRLQGQYTVNTKDLMADVPNKNNDIYSEDELKNAMKATIVLHPSEHAVNVKDLI